MKSKHTFITATETLIRDGEPLVPLSGGQPTRYLTDDVSPVITKEG